MTAAALLEDAAFIFAAAGVESAEWDVERFLGYVFGWDWVTLVANFERVVFAPDEERFRALF
jgi:hypothetical protein